VYIELSQTGGIGYFPGLSKPDNLDVDLLPEAAQAELRLLIDVVQFFNLPDSIGTPAPGAADYQYVTLKIVDGDHKQSVRVLVPVENKLLRELIQSIRKHLKATPALRP
jgi:hypothetical protein